MNISKKRIKSLFLLSCLLFSGVMLFVFSTPLVNEMGIKSEKDRNTKIDEFKRDYLAPKDSQGVTDEWWDGEWRFRVSLTTSLCEYDKMDNHVYVNVNFTDYLEKLGVGDETFDVNSIRLVEYQDATNFRETPYKINGSISNPENIQIVWILNGTTRAETQRNYYVYFDTAEYGPKTAPNYENLFSSTRAQYENNYLVIDDSKSWYTWTDDTVELTYEESLTLSDGTFISGNNAFRSYGNDHFKGWDLTNYAPFNYTVGNNADQIRYIDVWCYLMDSNADIMLQIQDDGNWDTRWIYDVEDPWANTYTYGYPSGVQGIFDGQPQGEWVFYRMDLTGQFLMDVGSYITGLAFSSNDNDALYDHIMFEKYNTTDIILEDEAEKKTAEVTITAKDVDGQVISGADIYLINSSATTPIIKEGVTNDLGQVTFENVSYGVYNITANYSLASDLTKTVYNSAEIGKKHNITTLYPQIEIMLDLWTIDFKVQDWDMKDLSYAYINVKNSSSGESLANLTLEEDDNGWKEFIWLNTTEYTYDLIYKNENYNPSETLITSGTVIRDIDLINSTTINVNQSNMLSGQSEYKIEESFMVDGSNQTGVHTYDIGRQTLISTEIELTNMEDNLTSVKIWYIDEEGNDDGSAYLLADKAYTTETTDFISLNLSGNIEAYGLRIEVTGNNQTTCNGQINVAFRETQTVYIKANLSSMDLYISDDISGSPVSEVIVLVENATSGESIVNLTTSSGYARDSYGNPFWYVRDDYNISLVFFNTLKVFNITNGPKDSEASITLDTYKEQDVEINLDPSLFKSAFNNTEGDQTVTWKDNMYFQVNFTVSDDEGDTWRAIDVPATVSYYIKTLSNAILFNGEFDAPSQGDGNYSKIIDSSLLEAGENYKVVVFGEARGYPAPYPETFFVTVENIPTQMSIYNYTSQTNYTTNEASAYWNENVNFTVFYYTFGNFAEKLSNAEITYSWTYGSGNIIQDPIKSEGTYYFTIDTADSLNVGKYQIRISAQLQNYSEIIEFDFFLNILTRPTSINNKTSLLLKSESIWVGDGQNYTFKYRDLLLSGSKIGNLDIYIYSWNKLDENGDPLSGTGNQGEANLIEDLSSDEYILDFDTELREVGTYSIFITLRKYNYELRNVFISLEIKERVINPEISAAPTIEDNKVEVVKGNSVDLEIQLKDGSRNDVPLSDATVKLKSADKEYDFEEESDGIYTLSIPTEEIEAFFSDQTLTGTITIEKDDYETETMEITIVVNMEEGPVPGLPTFYFFMIIGAIAAVGISLVSYRAVQLAKIPTFVKNAREMKKNVKGGKSIPESILYPSKQEDLMKRIGERWEFLGLSIRETLGLSESQKKKGGKRMKDVKKQKQGGM